MTAGIKSFKSNRAFVVRTDVRIGKRKLREFCETMVEDAKENAPFDTGNLRDSIDFVGITPDLFRVFGGGESAMYLPFQELGTSRMSGKWFMANAFDFAFEALGRTPWE